MKTPRLYHFLIDMNLLRGIPVFLLFLLVSGCLTPSLRNELAWEYYNIGNAYYSLNKYSQAIELYQKALTYNPDLAEGNFNLARVYFALGRYEEGLKLLEQLRSTRGENVLLLQTIAYGLAKQGRREEAIQYYLEVLNQSKGNTHALYNIGILYWELDRIEDAYPFLYQAYELAPEDIDILRTLGKVELRRNNLREALQYFTDYLKEKPDDDVIGLEAYTLLVEDRRYAEALALIESLLEKKKENPSLWFEKAYLLLTKAEEKEEGLTALETALELGFKDKQKLRVLFAETPPLYIEELKPLILRKGVYPSEELEEFFRELWGEQ
ncbi:MAG TPA: tetratricopeptide repeat protein [Spirochaetales bacterium]|nr:tetratricopeptide repeat protein [Spirochaetales bacterium]